MRFMKVQKKLSSLVRRLWEYLWKVMGMFMEGYGNVYGRLWECWLTLKETKSLRGELSEYNKLYVILQVI